MEKNRPTKYFIVLAMLFAGPVASHAVIILSEDFDNGYTETGGTGGTADLAGQNVSNSPFNGAWAQANTTAGSVDRTVRFDSFTSGVVVKDTSNASTTFYAERSVSWGTDAGTASYLSFDLTTGETVAEGGFLMMRFGNKPFIGAGIDAATGNIALTADGSVWYDSPMIAQPNTTYQLVLKVSNNGLNDPLSLYINPTSPFEGGQTVAASTTGNYYVPNNSSFRLNAIRIGKRTNTGGNDDGLTYFDNIIVSDSFADLVLVPEPSIVVLFGIGMASMFAFRRNRRTRR